jgi:three-Cys-motif partner protein
MLKENFLLPEEDGLPMRDSKNYARYKLKALETYLHITNTAMRNKWPRRYYIDLQAGPGKNRIGNDVVLGSPLIALSAPHPATEFRFNELSADLKAALEMRVSESPFSERVEIFQEDVNTVVNKVCNEISQVDDELQKRGERPTLNVAFLDPKGLELEWQTVTKLASINRMDLIITFFTSAIVRNIGAKNEDVINRFFGTDQWKKIDIPGDAILRKGAFITFYRERLRQFGYHTEIDPDIGGTHIAMKNSRNAEVYTLIFASKHSLGEKFWRQAERGTKPPRLPGL